MADLKFGAILFCEAFKFADGGESDKLFLVLGAKPNQNVITVICTSKPQRQVTTEGCHAAKGIYFCTKGGKNGHPKDTWYQLYRVVEWSAAELVKLSFSKQVRAVASLPLETTAAIRNCAKKTDDVTPRQIALME